MYDLGTDEIVVVVGDETEQITGRDGGRFRVRIVKRSDRGEYELADAIDLLMHAGYTTETLPFEGWRTNINTERDIRRAERKLS